MFFQHLSEKETQVSPHNKFQQKIPRKTINKLNAKEQNNQTGPMSENKGVESFRTNCGTQTE